MAEIGRRLGRKDLKLVASVALPDTILACYRRLIAQKFRRVETPLLPWPPPAHAVDRSPHRQDGPRELCSGTRPQRRRACPSRKFGGAELLCFVKRMYLGRSAAGIGSNPLVVAGCQVSERT